MWIARDKNNQLSIWNIKPDRDINDGTWAQNNCSLQHWLEIDSSILPELQWEDEALEVELISKEELTSLKILAALYKEEHNDNLFLSEE